MLEGAIVRDASMADSCSIGLPSVTVVACAATCGGRLKLGKSSRNAPSFFFWSIAAVGCDAAAAAGGAAAAAAAAGGAVAILCGAT